MAKNKQERRAYEVHLQGRHCFGPKSGCSGVDIKQAVEFEPEVGLDFIRKDMENGKNKYS